MTVVKPVKVPEPIPEGGWAVVRRWDDDIPKEENVREMVLFVGHIAAVIIGLIGFGALWNEEPDDDATDTD